VIAFVIVLQNLGYNISALIAGLGIGGVAVAFALQNILSDIFASFSIYFDKIGIKSTRLRSPNGQQIIISNKELTEARVQNFKRLEKRRAVYQIGVTYETPKEKLEKVPSIIKRVIDEISLAEFDRCHFKEFGDFSLNFEVSYYVKTQDYKTYLDVVQDVNLKIFDNFEKEEIEFAYPTQTIYLNKAKG